MTFLSPCVTCRCVGHQAGGNGRSQGASYRDASCLCGDRENWRHTGTTSICHTWAAWLWFMIYYIKIKSQCSVRLDVQTCIKCDFFLKSFLPKHSQTSINATFVLCCVVVFVHFTNSSKRHVELLCSSPVRVVTTYLWGLCGVWT